MPFVAYAVVLALLGLAAAVVWTAGRSGLPGLPGGDRASLAVPPAAAVEAARTGRALKLPPRPPSSGNAAPERAQPEPIAVPASASTAASPPQAEPARKPEPPKAECKVDLTRWPTDKSDQAQAVQMLLRDLGYYRGTTNGTVGPQTRTAIREFQLASGETETGEVGEALFESLKKKCAASP